MTDVVLQSYIDSVSLLAQAICNALDEEVRKLGFQYNQPAVAPFADAEYRLDPDPASGQDSLVGIWKNEQGQKCGELLFHADGSFYAEYDVVRIHPFESRWFVEAVTAWGRGNIIKSEARLLPVAG